MLKVSEGDMSLQPQRFLQFVPVIGSRELKGKVAKRGIACWWKFGKRDLSFPTLKRSIRAFSCLLMAVYSSLSAALVPASVCGGM